MSTIDLIMITTIHASKRASRCWTEVISDVVKKKLVSCGASLSVSILNISIAAVKICALQHCLIIILTGILHFLMEC